MVSTMHFFLRLLFVSLLLGSAAAQTGGATGDMAELVTRSTKVYLAWSTNAMSSPGASAQAKEIARSTAEGRLKVKYRIYLSGVPKNKTYTLFSWPITIPDPVETMKGLSVAPDGLVICAGQKPGQCTSPEGKKDDPIELAFSPSPGEPYRLALVSEDKESKVFFAIIPQPVLQADGGCTLQVVRLLPNFGLAVIEGTGFKPNEEIKFLSNSAGEKHELKERANAKGEYVTVLLPVVKGKDSGTATVSLNGSACAPSTSLQWGK